MILLPDSLSSFNFICLDYCSFLLLLHLNLSLFLPSPPSFLPDPSCDLFMPVPSVATPPSASSRASACLSVTSRCGYHVSEGNGARYGFYPCILLAPSPLLPPPPPFLSSFRAVSSLLPVPLPPSFLLLQDPFCSPLPPLPWSSSFFRGALPSSTPSPRLPSSRPLTWLLF